MSKKHKWLLALLIVTVLVIADQVLKIWVKTHMYLGESTTVTPWFQIRFIENNGMAFGWQIVGGKYLLTFFRLAMVPVLVWYIRKQIRQHRPTTFIVLLAMILAGDIGNALDCLLYGTIFNDPAPYAVAQFVPWGEGYSGLMLGRVVDMLYFPLIEWDMPHWQWLNTVPLLPSAGEHCVFFSPIFNLADAAISCAVIGLLFYLRITVKR